MRRLRTAALCLTLREYAYGISLGGLSVSYFKSVKISAVALVKMVRGIA